MYTEFERNIFYLCLKKKQFQFSSIISLFAQRPFVSHCTADAAQLLCLQMSISYLDFNVNQIGVKKSSCINGDLHSGVTQAWQQITLNTFYCVFFLKTRRRIGFFKVCICFRVAEQPCDVD